MRFRSLWIALSLTSIVLSCVSLGVFGLEYGVDFTGGTRSELQTTLSSDEIRETVSSLGYDDVVVQNGEGDQRFVRMGLLREDEHQKVLTALKNRGDVYEVSYSAVGPSVGAELRSSAIAAVAILLVLIAVYVAWAFRNVAGEVSSWKFGVVTLVTAFHDIIIPLGVFAVLGRVLGYAVDTAFVAAILTILGYSINDTIVVFDRTRERLQRVRSSEPFEDVVNKSVMETLGRSINTTLAVLLPLFAIFFIGGTSTRPFVLALIIGVAAGAFSSIFFASPLIVAWQAWSDSRRKA